MDTYTVTATREDDLWVARAVDADGATVTVLDFDDFDDMRATMPEAIADMLDVEASTVKVDWHFEVSGEDVTLLFSEYLAAADWLRSATERQTFMRDRLLRTLQEAGLSQRAMADVVGVSHQRVNQILKAS